MTKLSVNINKFATLRNSRGGNNPDVLKAAIDAQLFGADGVTVHPRPDERHIRYNDVREIKKIITTEFNIEGNCREQKFIDLVLEVKPHQVTLVPDAEGHHQAAIAPYVAAAERAAALGLGINAGHDLDLDNLSYFAQHIPQLAEVSIGHALVCDALYLGYENTIQLYKRQLSYKPQTI